MHYSLRWCSTYKVRHKACNDENASNDGRLHMCTTVAGRDIDQRPIFYPGVVPTYFLQLIIIRGDDLFKFHVRSPAPGSTSHEIFLEFCEVLRYMILTDLAVGREELVEYQLARIGDKSSSLWRRLEDGGQSRLDKG